VRRSNRWLLLLVAVPGMAFAPVPKPKPAKPDLVKEELKRLQGKWERVSLSLGDLAFRPAKDEALSVFKDDRLTWFVSGKVTDQWRVAPGPATRPGQMDLLGEEGERILCLYKLEGDTLTMCWHADSVEGRPADLRPLPGVWAQVLKRAKKP
jgi:uncharacterized protein (TIGR03067 family)